MSEGNLSCCTHELHFGALTSHGVSAACEFLAGVASHQASTARNLCCSKLLQLRFAPRTRHVLARIVHELRGLVGRLSRGYCLVHTHVHCRLL